MNPILLGVAFAVGAVVMAGIAAFVSTRVLEREMRASYAMGRRHEAESAAIDARFIRLVSPDEVRWYAPGGTTVWPEAP